MKYLLSVHNFSQRCLDIMDRPMTRFPPLAVLILNALRSDPRCTWKIRKKKKAARGVRFKSGSTLDRSHKSHNVSDKYPTKHQFVTEMCIYVHIAVTKWCLVGHGTGATGLFALCCVCCGFPHDHITSTYISWDILYIHIHIQMHLVLTKNMYKQIDSALSNKTSYIFACGEMLFHKKFFTKALHLNFQIHIEMSTLSSMKFGSHTTLLIKTIKSEKLVWFIGPSCSLLIGDCSWGSWTTRAEDNSYSSRCRLTSVVDASDPFVGNVGRDDMGISSAELSITLHLHTMDLLWEKFQWILPLYMKPINFQSKASVVCSVTAAISIGFCLMKVNVFSHHIGKKNKWIYEFRRTNQQELKCWSIFCVNYFLGYYLMMQHQPFVKRVNGTHEWAHRPYQLLITAACKNTGCKMTGSHPRAADRCPFVHRP